MNRMILSKTGYKYLDIDTEYSFYFYLFYKANDLKRI